MCLNKTHTQKKPNKLKEIIIKKSNRKKEKRKKKGRKQGKLSHYTIFNLF